jgi:hypothetical protein
MVDTEEKAQAWFRLIMGVAAGRLTVTEAAAQMGVSRKTYYEKQERAFAAMRAALQDRPTGRPGQPLDPEKAALQEELEAARKAQDLLASRLRIQEVLRQALLESDPGRGSKKKRTV